MASAIANLKSFWAANSTLNGQVPATKLFLDFVPSGTAFPFVRITEIGSSPEQEFTSGSHVEAYNYQLSIFHDNGVTLGTIGQTIIPVLDRAYITASSLTNIRTMKRSMCEVLDGKYIYSLLLGYKWTYQVTGA